MESNNLISPLLDEMYWSVVSPNFDLHVVGSSVPNLNDQTWDQTLNPERFKRAPFLACAHGLDESFHSSLIEAQAFGCRPAISVRVKQKECAGDSMADAGRQPMNESCCKDDHLSTRQLPVLAWDISFVTPRSSCL